MIQLENCRSVLVADDDKETRLYLRALIQSWGCRVSEAQDGQEAIDMVSRECPDLVLLGASKIFCRPMRQSIEGIPEAHWSMATEIW